MHHVTLWALSALVLLVATCVLVACGNQSEEVTRQAMPFRLIRLRNSSGPGGRPATAHAEGTAAGRPGPVHDVGPVPPGAQEDSQPPKDEESDAVTIRVTFDGGPTFSGSGSYPGSHIDSVDIDVAEPAGGQATVNFANGQPAEVIPLLP